MLEEVIWNRPEYAGFALSKQAGRMVQSALTGQLSRSRSKSPVRSVAAARQTPSISADGLAPFESVAILGRNEMHTALCWLVLGSAILPAADPVAEKGHYADHGVTFDYPKDWKLNTQDKKTTFIITAQTEQGSMAMVQVVPNIPDADDFLKQVYDVVKKQFEGKVVKDSEKSVKRKISGTELTGKSLEIEPAPGASIKQEMYAFKAPSKKFVVFVMLQTNLNEKEKEKIEKGFEEVINSLKEKDSGSGSGTGSPSGSSSSTDKK
jgi:hypothetical protein